MKRLRKREAAAAAAASRWATLLVVAQNIASQDGRTELVSDKW